MGDGRKVPQTKPKNYYTPATYTPFIKLGKIRDSMNLLKDDPDWSKILPPCSFGVPEVEYLSKESVRNQLHVDPSIT